MGLTRIDPTTVVDDDTGQQYYFPDLAEEDRAVPSVTRPTSDGLPRWQYGDQPVAGDPVAVDVGEAQIEQPPVSIGEARIESVGPLPDRTMAMTGRLPPGVGAGSGPVTGTPMSQEEVVARIAAATPAGAAASPSAGGDVGAPLDPYSAPPGPTSLAPLDPYGAPSAPQRSVPRRGGLAGLVDTADASAREAARMGASVKAEAARREGEGAAAEAESAREFAALQERETAAAQQRADARWNDWKRRNDDAANSEINPERFWESRTEFQKAAWIIALFAHGWANPGKPNQILEVLQQSIDRDMGAQKENKAGRERGLGREADAIARADARDSDALANRLSAQNLRIDALKRATEARVKALGPAAETADYAGVIAQLDEAKLKNEVALRKAQADEEMDRARLRIDQGRLAVSRAAEKRQAENDKAERERAAAKAKADAAGGVEGPNLDPRLGLTTIAPDGRRIPGGWAFKQTADQGQRVAGAAAAGNKEYTALIGLREALRDQTLLDKLRSSDSKVREEAVKLAYAKARQLGGPGVLSNQDVDTAMQTVTGQSGLSGWAYLVTPGDPLELVEDGIVTLEDRVNQEIVGTGNVDVSRGQLVWKPRLLRPDKPGKRTPADVRAEAAGLVGGETSNAELRNPDVLSLGDLPPGIRANVYEHEKATGKLPKLSKTEADFAVESVVTEAQSPTADLEDIDKAIYWAETADLDPERRARAIMELRAARVAAARRDADKAQKAELLRRGTAK